MNIVSEQGREIIKDKKSLLVVIGVLLGFYMCYFLIAPGLIARGTIFDDSYMFIRYALNFLAGYGYAWNRDGVQTFGCTSIPYTFLIVAGKYIFPNLSDGNLLVYTCGLLGLLSIVILGYTSGIVSESRFFKNYGWAIIAIFLLTNRLFFAHTMTGMDTMLSFLANTLLILALHILLKNQNISSAIIAAFAAYFTFLVRPDNGIFMIAFPSLFLLLLYRGEKKPVVIFVVSLIFLLAADSFIKYTVFGDVLPLTYYAKKSGFYTGYIGAEKWNPVLYIFWFLIYTFPVWIPAIITYEKKQRKIALAYGIPVVCTFLYYFTVVQIMGFQSRFYFPSLPFFIIGGILIIDRSELLKNPSWRELKVQIRLKSLPIMAAVLAVGIIYPLSEIYGNTVLKVMPLDGKIVHKAHWEGSNPGMVELSKRLPVGTVIAASEHGLLSSENPALYIIDVTGLHDPVIAHKGFTVDYLIKRSPDIIWMPHYDYTGQNMLIKQDQRFKDQYDFFPEEMGFGLAIKKGNKNLYDIVINRSDKWK